MALVTIQFPSFKIFDKLLKASEAIDDMIYILPKEEGVSVTHIDPTRALFLNHFISKDDLVNYEYDPDYIAEPEDKRVIPLVIKDLKKALKVAKKDSSVSLSLIESGLAVVKVEGQYTTRAKMRVGSTGDWQFLKIPNLEFPSTIKIYGKLLKDMLSLAKATTSEFVFEIGEKGLIFRFEGLNIEQEVEVPYDNDLIIDVEAEIGAKGIYGVGFLANIAKAIEAGDQLTIEWGYEMPMRLNKPILNHSYLEWWLAPRVGDEE